MVGRWVLTLTALIVYVDGAVQKGKKQGANKKRGEEKNGEEEKQSGSEKKRGANTTGSEQEEKKTGSEQKRGATEKVILELLGRR